MITWSYQSSTINFFWQSETSNTYWHTHYTGLSFISCGLACFHSICSCSHSGRCWFFITSHHCFLYFLPAQIEHPHNTIHSYLAIKLCSLCDSLFSNSRTLLISHSLARTIILILCNPLHDHISILHSLLANIWGISNFCNGFNLGRVQSNYYSLLFLTIFNYLKLLCI